MDFSREDFLRCTHINLYIIACLQAQNALDKLQVSQLSGEKSLIKRSIMIFEWIQTNQRLCDVFLQVMEQNDQQHVSNLLKGIKNGPHIPLSPSRYERLLRYKPKLMLIIKSDKEFLANLTAKHAISEIDRQDIEQERKEYKRNWNLIEAILRRSDHAFDCFEQTLKETLQVHVASYLHEGHVVAAHVNTTRPETDEVISGSLNKAILSELKDDTPYEDKILTPINGYNIHPVAAKPGKSVVLFLYCKTVDDMITFTELFISGNLQSIVEVVFNRLLSKTYTVGTEQLKVKLSLDDEEIFEVEKFSGIEDWIPVELEKATTEFTVLQNAATQTELQSEETEPHSHDQTAKYQNEIDKYASSTASINELPLELLDIILQKSYLLYVLSGKQPTERKDEFFIKRLSLVCFCWFQTLSNQRFKKTIWRRVTKCLREEYRYIIILRNNLSYLEENIQTKNLVSRLRSVDCLKDVERRLLSRKTLIKSMKNLSRKKNNSDILHLMRSFDGVKHSDFLRCLQKSNPKLITRVVENGGVSLKAIIFNQDNAKRQSLDQKIKDLRSKAKPRSHQIENLIRQLKDDNIDLRSSHNSLLDRQTVVWIWCQSQKSLEIIQMLNKYNSLPDVLTALTSPSSSTEISNPVSVTICRDQFKKQIEVVYPICFNFDVGADEYVMGVTKLRNEIYVLSRSKSPDRPPIIRIFEDWNPFRLQEEIHVKAIEYPWDIGSIEKENCLYVSDCSLDNTCVWKITKETDNQYKIVKWLTMEYEPDTMSMSSNGEMLVVSESSSILRIYGSDTEVLRSIQLPSEIKTPIHAIQTSVGNYIILHKWMEENHERKKWPSGREWEMKWGICELTREGQMVARRLIPSNETEKLNYPSYLSLDSDDGVFVADFGNDRVVLLDFDLKWNRIVCSTKEENEEKKKILRPIRLFYDKDKTQLIVALFEERVNVYTFNRK